MQLGRKRWTVIHISLLTAGLEVLESEYVKMSSVLVVVPMILSTGLRLPLEVHPCDALLVRRLV